MAYTIKNSDGTILLTLGDGKVDQLTTSLALVGKNVSSYGQYYNDNLIALLENFASTDQPRSPLTGQIWYDKTLGRLYVYGLDNTFSPVSGALISNTRPLVGNFNQGDLWIDSTNQQLWFAKDDSNFVLAGPQYSSINGKSGWIVETISDTDNVDQVIACLYNKNILLGIASSVAFTVASPGYPADATNNMKSVNIGFNLNTSLAGIRFVGTATSADSIQGYYPASYLTTGTTAPQVMLGSLSILTNTGILIGGNQDISISSDSANSNLTSNITNKGFRIRGTSSVVGYFTALKVDTATRRVGFFTENPAYPVDIVGDTRISGNLYVVGSTTNIESVNLQVKDKNIQLGYGQLNSTDSAIEGGGITLMGTTDHTLSWTSGLGQAWQASDNFNLIGSTSSYKINGVTVISTSSIGIGITSAPGITSFGTLTNLTIGSVYVSSSTVTTTGSNQTLFLSAAGNGTIDVTDHRVTNVSPPIDYTDAATKKYVDDSIYLVGTKGFIFSLDITSMTNVNLEILAYLNSLLPVSNPPEDAVFDLPDGVRARVLCSRTTVTIPQEVLTINYATAQVDQNGVPLSQSVLTSVAGILPTFNVVPTFTYSTKEFRVLYGVWEFTRDIV